MTHYKIIWRLIGTMYYVKETSHVHSFPCFQSSDTVSQTYVTSDGPTGIEARATFFPKTLY